MNIGNVLKETAAKYPEKPAVIFKDSVITFKELLNFVNRISNVFISIGIKKGDRVGLYLGNCPELFAGYLAIFNIGAVAVPLDAGLKEEEVTSALIHSQASLVLSRLPQNFDLKTLKTKVSTLKDVILCGKEIDGLNSFNALTASASADDVKVEVSDTDMSIIFYTSGTTGKPKGVVWNYKHLDSAPMAMRHFVNLSDKDIKLCAIPLTHSGGFVYLQNCIVFGITIVLMEQFIPSLFLKNIEAYKITCMHLVPSMFMAILNMKEFQTYDLKSLQWMFVFGAPSSPDILRRFHTYCPHTAITNGWGMTETSPPNTVSPPNRVETIGRPAPWVNMKIVDYNNNEVPTGEIGEIVIKGWVVMDGYYKEPALTADSMTDGWFHTGDLGMVDGEGFFYIKGRKKDMIIVGGLNVYSPDVEAVLLKHPNVKECAVFGIPDITRGEAVKAAVVTDNPSSVTDKDLKSFCRQHLATYKVPDIIEFKETLPKTSSGKIQKEALK